MLYSVVIESNDTESSTFHKQHSQTVDMNNHHYLTLENQCYIHQLHINNDNTIHKQYNVYWIYLIVIFLFYSIPVYQLILTYQRVNWFIVVINCYITLVCTLVRKSRFLLLQYIM